MICHVVNNVIGQLDIIESHYTLVPREDTSLILWHVVSILSTPLLIHLRFVSLSFKTLPWGGIL